MSRIDEVKACPHCGKKPHQTAVAGTYWWRVYCDNKECEKRMSTQWWPRELAVILWNKDDVIPPGQVWVIV